VSLDWCTATSVLSLGNDTLERRTMLLLYNLFRLHPRPEIEVRQQDVAEMLGVVRQSLQPILRGLQREGLVSLGYGEIVVGDADALLTALQTTKLPPS
jgi:CRP-like cAMP-binding protein